MQVIRAIEKIPTGYKVTYQVGESKTETIEYTTDEYNRQFSLMKQAIMSNGQPIISESLPEDNKLRDEIKVFREEMLSKLENQANLTRKDWENLNQTITDTMTTRSQLWEGVHKEAEDRLISVANAITSAKLLGEKAIEELSSHDKQREEVISELSSKSEVTWGMAQRSREDSDKLRSEIDAYVKDMNHMLDKITEEKDSIDRRVEGEQVKFRQEMKAAFEEQKKIIEESTVIKEEREKQRLEMVAEENKKEIRNQYIEKELGLKAERDKEILGVITKEVTDLVASLESEYRAIKEALNKECEQYKIEDGNLKKLLDEGIVSIENEQEAIRTNTFEVSERYQKMEIDEHNKIDRLTSEAVAKAENLNTLHKKIEETSSLIEQTKNDINTVQTSRNQLITERKTKEDNHVKKVQESLKQAEESVKAVEIDIQEKKAEIVRVNKLLSDKVNMFDKLTKTLKDETVKPPPVDPELGPIPSPPEKKLLLKAQDAQKKADVEKLKLDELNRKLKKQAQVVAQVKAQVKAQVDKRKKAEVDIKLTKDEYEAAKAKRIKDIEASRAKAVRMQNDYRKTIREATEASNAKTRELAATNKRFEKEVKKADKAVSRLRSFMGIFKSVVEPTKAIKDK